MILFFVVWGSRLCGKTDAIEGIGHVATKFGHLYYIPLFPTGSFFVTSENDDGGWSGAKIPMSAKSLGIAWGRTACIIFPLLISLFGIGFMGGASTLGQVFGGVFIGGSLLLGVVGFFALGSSFVRNASYERAVEIGNELGFDPGLMVFIDRQYGKIDDAQAAQRMHAANSSLHSLDNLDDELAASNLNERFQNPQ